MESKWMGWNLGGEPLHGLRERSSSFVVAAFFLVALNGVARAQICPTAPCSANANCNDGLFCTVDICINPGPSGHCICVVNSCNDNLFCTNDVCNETTNTCNHTPHICPALTPHCDEALDACVQCTDNSHCTTSPRLYCNSSGTCVQCISHSQCDDDKFCNGQETCNFSTGLCQNGTPPSCSRKCFMGPTPGTNCTSNANCGSGGTCPGICLNGTSNGDPCNTNADCGSGGTCQGCSNQLAKCAQCELDAGCDNGKFCDGAERCSKANNQCVVGTPPVCKKCVGGSNTGQPCSNNADCGNPPGSGTCTGAQSYCDELSDQCVQCLSPSHCDDLNFCTNNACVFNSCIYSPSLAICSDGIFCNGEEVCTWAVGNPCSIFGDRAHCCSAGTSVNCADPFTCTVDSCNETNDSCQHILNNALCPGSNLACNGTETCEPGTPGADPASGCKDGTPIDCSAFGGDPDCSEGVCLETPQVHCQASAIRQGLGCDDVNPCTALSKCNNGFCVDNPPAPSDPYRCVKLVWRANGLTTVLAGSTIQLDLFAVANGCNTPTPECPGTSLRIFSIDALFSWNKTFLQLNPSTGPDPNPVPACVASCGSCPINTYNWLGSGGADFWPNDCNETGDHLNEPCAGGVPGNDGNARILSFQGPNQSCPDPCATAGTDTTGGLKVTTIKFKAISGGTSQIAFLPCFGDNSKTQVQSSIVAGPTTDATKSLGPAITITVKCDGHDDCNDNNACTNDTCSCTTSLCGGTCLRANNTNPCDDGLFCTTNDLCSNGQCVGNATTCKTCVGGPDAGKPCASTSQCAIPGTCTGAPSLCEEANDRCAQCSSAAHCNDGLGSTVDTCVDGFCVHTPIDCNDNVACTIDQTVEPSGTCINTPDDAFCNPTNSFCSAAICDPVDGCILDHECISVGGNPCLDPATCNETTNTCGGCNQPIMVPAGCRYLNVTPASQGSTRVALLVTGDCSDPNAVCVYRYVQSKCSGGPNNGLNCNTDADCPKRCVGGLNPGAVCTIAADCPLGECAGKCDAGTLGSTPYYKTASQWGTAKVRGAQIRPETTYMVHAECNFPGGAVLSSAASATTWIWGDDDGNRILNVTDVSNLVNALKGFFGPYTFEQMNIWGNTPSAPCTPDGVINALDIALVVDAVKGFAYPCSVVCP